MINRMTAGVLALLLALAPAVNARAETPSKYHCELNQKAASAAADSAIQNQHELSKAGAGLVVGGSCLGFLYLTGWFDGGATAAVCGLLTTAAVVATPTPAAAEIAQEAYQAVRDPNCVGK